MDKEEERKDSGVDAGARGGGSWQESPKHAGSVEPTGDEDVGERRSSRCAAVTRGEGAGRGELLAVFRAVMAGEDIGAHMLHQERGGGGRQQRTSHPSVPPPTPPLFI